MIEFYESSAFTKLFIAEAESNAVLQRYKSGRTCAISRLALLEVRSVIRRLETALVLTAGQAARARTSLDIEAGKVLAVELTENILVLAQQLMDRNNIRSLDAVQLASALSLQQKLQLCSSAPMSA